MGMRGNITKLIQSMLYCRGYNPGPLDGIFGSGTQNAVMNFQLDNGLNADCIVGKNTFKCLFA
jgi:peptidoglycan hydrolase-like protein with peptidoglycan-binding domain